VSRIDDLIQELCPDGVLEIAIGEHVRYEQPTKYIVASTDYSDAYACPVLTAGKSFLLGRTNETIGIYPASPSSPVIIFDDFTTAFKWVDFPFKVKSSAMKIITANPGGLIELRFLYHWMGRANYVAAEHARHWISVYSKMDIPAPPLEVQREIVKVLDKFTQLEAELEAELAARRKQYEYYRDKLLTFKELDAE